MMKIEILGMGCQKCSNLMDATKKSSSRVKY